MTTADLIKFCEDNSEVPDDEHKTYIPYYYPSSVDDEKVDEYGRPIFTVVWATPNTLRRLSAKLGQIDATYKLNWFDWPVFVCGRSSTTGRYLYSICSLSLGSLSLGSL